MVMIALAPGITNINGKCGGDIYRYDVCGHHIQTAPRVVRRGKETPQQRAFGRCKIAWSDHEWTDSEIEKWWLWCKANPIVNKKAETRYMHPFLAFLSVNIKRIIAGKVIIYEPP